MPTTTSFPLARLAAPLALTAGALVTVTQLIGYITMSGVDPTNAHWKEVLMANPIFIGYGITYFLALCVLMLALVAVYGWGSNEMGGLGIIGFGAALIGTANMAGNMWFEGFVSPWLAQVAPALLYQPSGWVVIGGWSSYILFTLGWVLFGIASLRAHIFPTVICLAMIVGGIAGLVASPPFAIPLGLTITTLGIWLLRTTTVTSETPVRATA